jgi:hypothetical protein
LLWYYSKCPRAHEVSITGKITVSGGQQHIVDPEASLRAELNGAIAAAQIDIANAISELARSGGDNAALTYQRQALLQLHRTVGSASLGGLLALRGEVANSANSATTLANQAIGSATNTAAAQANLSPSERARANIQALNRDLFENRRLDPYLQFNSPEDEEAYRKRERERKEEIDRAMALGTPEGIRRATELTKDQLRDAGAHGADRSPDYAGMVQRADAAMVDLQPQIIDPSHADVGVKPTQSGPLANPDDGLGDILASLKAAGVTTPAIQTSDAGHGVILKVGQSRESAAPVKQN